MSGKTLVIQPLPGVGDMLWYLPYLRAIARHTSTGKISILTKPSVQVEALLGHEGFLEHTLLLNRPSKTRLKMWELVRFLKSYEFQSVWILHHSPHYALACQLAGIPERRGYGFGIGKFFLNTPPYLASFLKRKDPKERARHFLTDHQIMIYPEDQLLTPSPQALSLIQTKYEDCPKPWIVFGFGASQDFKCWPIESFARLASSLRSKYGGTIFFLGAPQEKSLGEQGVSLAQQTDAIARLATDLSLDQAAALISQASFYVGNCSGPLNIAGCLGIPSFGLFGATEPLTYSSSIFSITPPVSSQEQGMHGISVEDVLSAIEKHISLAF